MSLCFIIKNYGADILVKLFRLKRQFRWRFRSIKIIVFGQPGSDSVWRENKEFERINSFNLFWLIFILS